MIPREARALAVSVPVECAACGRPGVWLPELQLVRHAHTVELCEPMLIRWSWVQVEARAA